MSNKIRQEKVYVADIVRTGEKLVVPESMPLSRAIDVLTRQMKDEEELIAIHEPINVFPWEGAIAFRKAIELSFGYGGTIASPGFFGPTPPSEIAVETGVGTKTMVPWGRFRFALADSPDEYLATGTAEIDGRLVFAVQGVVKKKWKATIAKLADLTRKIAYEESIYRGKALRIAFTDDDGDVEMLPQPKFIDLRGVKLDEMVYTDELTTLIDTNVFTPLRHADALREAGIPRKRGVLLAGPYGTGKSLLALATAKVGTDHGWTYIYIKDASELPDALNFAKHYQPAIIFAEDVDRHVTGERTDEMDEILNTLDGIESKTNEIMVVLTTNHLDNVNRAMLRPGRLDVILNVVPPDAKAVERLVRVYARQGLDASTDLTKVGELLAGYTPAVIREVVERAKLVTISRTGKANSPLNAEDIEVSAATMVQQQNLLKQPEQETPHWSKGLAAEVAEKTYENIKANGIGSTILSTEKGVEALRNRFGV